jgi:Na+-driven multidrug efflux pump
VPLVIRTLALRAALLLTTWAAARQGSAAVAAHQVASAVWSLLALALDALAIAAQALTGRWLGAGNAAAVRAVTSRMIVWGCGAGAVLGTIVLASRTVLAPLFGSDPQVRGALVAALLVVALAQPLAGYVFVLDGVLIGAGDGRFLAVAGSVQLALYVPVVIAVAHLAPGGAPGLAWLWAAFAGWYMLTRAVFLGVRERGSTWMVLGAVR